jgi:ankyrin repeat protein
MLHIAVGTEQNDFVKWLLDFIGNNKQIARKNSDGCTALHVAAIVGNRNAVKLLLEKTKIWWE